MKHILFAVALLATGLVQQSFAQDSLKTQHSSILTSYYHVKDALVKGNSDAAGINATAFLKAINETEKAIITPEYIGSLVNDATSISRSNDIKVQREKFASLSANLLAVLKKTKLSNEPIYQMYCPMKKAVWLSDIKAIKNPYYGSAMLTCGSIKETL